MHDWFTALTAICGNGPAAVLVTVASTKGSAPRDTGAKMLVTAHEQFGTIGGGHLEWRAGEIARAMLAMPPDTLSAQRRLERFPLGPSLGQCCGGMVHLAFERFDTESSAHVADLQQRWHARQDSWRVVALDAALPPALCAADGNAIHGSAPIPAFDRQAACRVISDATGKRWLIDPVLPYRAHLFLFGAGHVGSAIVRALADLPCRVTWVDERDGIFPPLPPNVQGEVTDMPEAIIDAAPPDSCFLVMTHSHALDQRLAEHILRRGDARWFGLIGSQSKRMQFEHRLRERGIPDQQLVRMVCPIGVPGIEGKAPAVIAVAVAAQLLQVWSAAGKAAADLDALRSTTPNAIRP